MRVRPRARQATACGSLCLHGFVRMELCAILTAFLPPLLHAGVNYPGGFLYEWWVVFWEIFSTRSNQSYSEAAANYLEVQRAKQQQQLLQLQLHQTIQQRKYVSPGRETRSHARCPLHQSLPHTHTLACRRLACAGKAGR